MTFSNYLAVLADNDLFGSLALFSLMVALAGLHPRIRANKAYKVLAFVCLLIMPTLHLAGSYFLSQPPA